MAYTTRDIIRLYSGTVERGTSDTDLNPRTRRLVTILLNTASNDGAAGMIAYPPSDDDRAAIIARFHNAMWNSNTSTLIAAVSPSGADAYSAAMERATIILRGI